MKANSKINFLYSTLYQVLLVLTPLITAPYLSRVIGADGIGVYSYTNNIASYFVMFGMLGLTNYGNRQIAVVRTDKERLNKTFSSIYYLQVIIGVGMTILYLLYLVLLVKDNKFIRLIEILPVLASIININWLFMGLEQFKVTVTRSIVIKIFTLISIIVFVNTKSDLWKYVFILSLGAFCENIPLIILAKKYIKLVKVKWSDVIKHLKPNIILFIPVLSVSIYRTMDKIMLGFLSNYTEVGYFENADKIINICMGFIIALGQVMLPKSANMIAQGKVDESNKLIQKSIIFSTLICSAMVFGIIGIASVFVPIFLGKDFVPSQYILITLAPNIFLLAWGNVIKTQYLIARCKDKVYIISTLLGAIVNVILNFILIPRYQGIGAAISTLAAELISVVYITYIMSKEINIKKIFQDSIVYIIIGIVMMLGINLIKQNLTESIASLIIMIIVGGIIFCTECIILYYNKNKLMIEIFDIVKKVFARIKK